VRANKGGLTTVASDMGYRRNAALASYVHIIGVDK